LRRTRDELSAILANASVGIVFTRNRVIDHCNQRGAEIFGYDSPQALVGQQGIAIYPSEASYERLGGIAGPLLAAGESFQTEWQFRRRDDRAIWCRIYGKAVNPSRTEQGTVWIVEDITDAKRTELALHQTLREMEAIMRNAPLGIIFTRERRILRYNANVMPVMSGLEATRRLREQQAFANVPIIAVSASASRADRERSLAAGVNAFLRKPIDFNDLRRDIGALLNLTWTYEGD
jgi:PAS domain S-box-containing protein